MIRAIIVDDLPLAIASLKSELEDYFSDEIEIVGTAEGVVEAAKLILRLKPEVVFLDIHMEDGDGFDLLDIINTDGIKVVFTTASQDHALKAFEYAAVDYLLKPVDKNQIERAIQKLDFSKQTGVQEQTTIALSTQDAIRIVEKSRIVRFEAEGNYTKVFLDDGKMILISKTLKSFDERVGENFIRVHQSHLINIDYVEAYVKTEGGYLRMTDQSSIPVAVRKKSYVVSMLSQK